jgi:hypothetical protein
LELFSPNLKWQIDTSIKMLCLADTYLTEDTISSIINVIINSAELSVYSVFKLYLALKNNYTKEGLAKTAIYVIGELGDILVNNTVQGPDNETLRVSEDDVLSLFKTIQDNENTSQSVLEYLMNALVKLSNKFSQKSVDVIYEMIEPETRSYFYEVQQRAVDYTVFRKVIDPNLQKVIVENIPISKSTNENINRK